MTGRRLPSRAEVVLLLAGLVVVMAAAWAALGRGPATVDERARAIELQLRCPTCQGLSIADSPAQSAVQMRALVRDQLAAGATDDDVRAFFVQRYGRWILLDPPIAGPDVLLWIAPAAIVALGALLVVRRGRRGSGPTATIPWRADPAPATPRAGTVAIALAMTIALAVPIAAAVGPRFVGREISGGAVAAGTASIEELEAYVAAEPSDVEALVALGDALLAANRPADAASRYRAALELDPENVPSLLGIGTILLAADRPDAAGPVFDRILAISPDAPDALLFRAVARKAVAGALTPQARRDVERFLELAAADDPRREMATRLLADAGAPAPGPSERPAASSSPAGRP